MFGDGKGHGEEELYLGDDNHFADAFLFPRSHLTNEPDTFDSLLDGSGFEVPGGPKSSATDTSTTTPPWGLSPTPLNFDPQLDSLAPAQPQTRAQLEVHPSASHNSLPLPRRHRRKPMPRKGHTKSRRGCLNCKRRKVKCQETRPECGHCQKMALVCEYPPEQPTGTSTARFGASAGSGCSSSASHGERLGSSAMGCPGYALQTGTVFNLLDMRFFQHFLVTAYPPLPLGGGEIWKSVSAMAHHYDFLIHAMLGLGASHLTLCGETDYAQSALSHRVAAMKSLNAFLSKADFSEEDGDAAFAAVMSLTFQTSYMEDGLVDFLAMVRGCHIVAVKAMPDFNTSAFRSFSREEHVSTVRALAAKHQCQPKNYGTLVENFCRSIMFLAPICKSTIELTLMADIHSVARQANTDPHGAYNQMTGMYNTFGYMSNEDFTTFTDPENHVAKILMVHFFLVDYVLGMTSLEEIRPPSFEARKAITLRWMEGVLMSLPEDYRKYVAWVLSFARTIMPRWKQPGGGDPEWMESTWGGNLAKTSEGTWVTAAKADISSDMFTYRPSDQETICRFTASSG